MVLTIVILTIVVLAIMVHTIVIVRIWNGRRFVRYLMQDVINNPALNCFFVYRFHGISSFNIDWNSIFQ